jgi:hypothetical protein
MKAYILSSENGTVQIGNTVFQPSTHKKFNADKKGLSKKDWVEVSEKSFQGARMALRALAVGLPDGGPSKDEFEKRENKIRKEYERAGEESEREILRRQRETA